MPEVQIASGAFVQRRRVVGLEGRTSGYRRASGALDGLYPALGYPRSKRIHTAQLIQQDVLILDIGAHASKETVECGNIRGRPRIAADSSHAYSTVVGTRSTLEKRGDHRGGEAHAQAWALGRFLCDSSWVGGFDGDCRDQQEHRRERLRH